jgi:hypothetical protein
MAKVLFDTSVIVAGLWLEHPEHQKCLPWLQQGASQFCKNNRSNTKNSLLPS